MRRYWKTVQPRSLRQATELCKEYARENKNYSVERIAENMGLADHHNLYKWMHSGRMPAVLIPAFEAACGVNFVSRWLAARSGKLVIDMPTARKMSESDMHQLQAAANQAVGALLSFYGNGGEAEQAIDDITTAIEHMAWHRANVEIRDRPQLEMEVEI